MAKPAKRVDRRIGSLVTQKVSGHCCTVTHIEGV